MHRVDYSDDAAQYRTYFTYDVDSRLVTTNPPAGDDTTYTYDHRGFLSQTDTPDGTAKQWVDAGGNVRRTEDYRGNNCHSEFDALDRVTQTMTPGGSTYGSGGGGGPTWHTATYTYDLGSDAMRQSTLTQSGSPAALVTVTTYDARGNVISVLEPDEKTETITVYDEAGHAVATENWYDGDVRTATVSFLDARGRCEKTRRQNASFSFGQSAPSGSQTSYTLYNITNAVVRTVDPAGDVATTGSYAHKTTYTLDLRDRVTQVKNGLGQILAENEYGDDDLLSKSYIPDPTAKSGTPGMVVSRKFTYTNRKEVKTSLDKDDHGDTFTYNELPGQVNTVTDVNSVVTHTTYNSSTQRVYEVIRAEGISGVETKTKTVWANGFLTETHVTVTGGSYGSTPFKRYYDKAGRLERYEAPSVDPQRHLYDDFGREIEMIQGTRNVVHTYDTLGRHKSADSTGYAVGLVEKDYDEYGNLTKIDHKNGSSSLFRRDMTYDWKGNPDTETFKVGGSTWKSQSHDYDADTGNYTDLTDPQGKTHHYVYDDDNRVTEIWYDGAMVTQVSYTPGGRIMQTAHKNSSSGTIAVTTHDYDTHGRHTRAQTVQAGTQKTLCDLKWEYDTLHRVNKITYAHLNAVVTITYNQRGEVLTEALAANSSGSSVPSYTNVTTTAFDGVLSNASSSADGAVVTLTTVPFTKLTYTYDKAGNRLTKTADTTDDSTDNGVTTTNTYNDANQLTNESTTVSSVTTAVAHSYDILGNEYQRVTTVTSQPTVTESYGYNYLNVMSTYAKSLSGTGTTVSWNYDYWPTGDRYSKTNNLNSSDKEYYLSKFGDVVCDYDNNLAIKNSYAQGNGIDSKSVRIASGGSRRHYLGDMVGTVAMTLDDSGVKQEESLKDIWGNQLVGNTNSERYGYAQREDDPSGLVYMRYRMYDAKIGRFTQTDPLRWNQPHAHYTYARNNPISGRDPMGLITEDEAAELRQEIETYKNVDPHLSELYSNLLYAEQQKDIEAQPGGDKGRLAGSWKNVEWLKKQIADTHAAYQAAIREQDELAGMSGDQLTMLQFRRVKTFGLKVAAISAYTSLAAMPPVGAALAEPVAVGAVAITATEATATAGGLATLARVVSDPRFREAAMRLEARWAPQLNALQNSGQVLNMAVSRKDALARIQQLVPTLEKHLSKIVDNPLSRDVPHWRSEIQNFLTQMENLIPNVGQKTAAEWTTKIEEWRQRLNQ